MKKVLIIIQFLLIAKFCFANSIVTVDSVETRTLYKYKIQNDKLSSILDSIIKSADFNSLSKGEYLILVCSNSSDSEYKDRTEYGEYFTLMKSPIITGSDITGFIKKRDQIVLISFDIPSKYLVNTCKKRKMSISVLYDQEKIIEAMSGSTWVEYWVENDFNEMLYKSNPSWR